MAEKACVVLPTYNEAANIAELIPLIFAQAEKIPTHELHVLVVDDNSSDGTAEVVRSLMPGWAYLHLITGEKKGLGDAYTRGFAYALVEVQADLVFQMDSDFQHDPALLPLFAAHAACGFTLVIGSRFVPGGSTPDFGFIRRFLSKAAAHLIHAASGIPRIRDCTSGYRCIHGALLKRCNLSGLSTRGYSFQSSLLCELVWRGAKVIEVPIIFSPRKQGQSKLTFKDQREFVSNLFRIFARRRQMNRL